MKRVAQKEETHGRIVEVAARLFRKEGLAGAGVQRIMADAGLTHGGFYSHFDSKADLIAEAFAAAAREDRERLFTALQQVPATDRLAQLVRMYLSRSHRDARNAGCPLPAISAEISREPAPVRRAYETELLETVARIEQTIADAEDMTAHDRAVGTLALCVGGLLLARAVDDVDVSDDILHACRRFAGIDAREQG